MCESERTCNFNTLIVKLLFYLTAFEWQINDKIKIRFQLCVARSFTYRIVIVNTDESAVSDLKTTLQVCSYHHRHASWNTACNTVVFKPFYLSKPLSTLFTWSWIIKAFLLVWNMQWFLIIFCYFHSLNFIVFSLLNLSFLCVDSLLCTSWTMRGKRAGTEGR